MKICDLALFSESTSSGVKTYIASKIDYVGRHPGLDHVVIVPGSTDTERSCGRSKVIVVRGARTPYPGVRLGLNLGKIARIIAREAPDLIEVNCQFTLAWAAFMATRARQTPVVGIYHTDVPACARHWARGGGHLVAAAVERLVELYEGLIYRHCTLTVLLNDRMQDRIARLGVRRTICLPCGVDASLFHPERRDDAFRMHLGIEPHQTAIFYAGRFSPEKELDVLFEAYEQLPPGDFVLVLAGDGPDVAAIRNRARTDATVRYIGHVESRADLATAYASTDVFVTPGRYETFGMSTLEAMSSGLPIVGIKTSGTASFVPPEAGVMATAGDASDVARAITEIAAWDRITTARTCHRLAADGFSWDRVFDRYFAAYAELVRAGATATAGAAMTTEASA
jgi:alpha-1,6-mannosyltransferase